ncbi:hypothetical protein DXU07_42795 [Bradyrhizobium elkanii]
MLRANIAHFKELPAIETDAVKIAMLRRLRSPWFAAYRHFTVQLSREIDSLLSRNRSTMEPGR